MLDHSNNVFKCKLRVYSLYVRSSSSRVIYILSVHMESLFTCVYWVALYLSKLSSIIHRYIFSLGAKRKQVPSFFIATVIIVSFTNITPFTISNT